MKLIPNWKKAWRMFSVQADALTVAMVAVWGLMPQEWKSSIPDGWLLAAAVVFAGLGIVGRLIEQPKTR